MILQDPARRTGWCAWAIIAVLLLILPLSCHHAIAQAPGSRLTFDCKDLGETIEFLADFRDTGADLARLERLFRDRYKNKARVEVVLREVRRMWLEGLTAREAGFQLYERCQKRLGDMTESDV